MTKYFPDVFDSSILASYKACPQLFKKTYLDQWKSKERNVHLHAGGAFAKGLEVARRAFYEEHFPAETAIELGLGALLQAYGDFECPQDSAKSAERTAGAFEFYFENYPLTEEDGAPITLPSGKRGVEFSFAHPLPIPHPLTGDPLIYCGRMDAIISFGGGIHVCDEKTTSSLGASWSRQWDLRSQFTGYVWGALMSGIHVDGCIVRGVSILKTKYDTQQAISFRPAWQVDRWYNQLVDTVGEILWRWEQDKWPYNLDHACADYGGCQFRLACSSQDETPWLETGFVRKHWSPITREETLL